MVTATTAASVDRPIAVIKIIPHISSWIDLANAIHDLAIICRVRSMDFFVVLLMFSGHQAVVDKKARIAPVGTEMLIARIANFRVTNIDSATTFRNGSVPSTGFS